MLGKLFKRNQQITVKDTVSGASDVFNIITDGIGAHPDWSTGAYRGGMGIPAAWRAANLLSDLIGSLPFHAYREFAGRPVEKVFSQLLDQPNPPDPRVVTFSSMVLDLLWHGNAVAVIAARSADGWPVAIVPVSAEFMHVRRTRDGIVYQLGGQEFSPSEVLHVKGPCAPGELRGMGVLENHFDTIRLSQAQLNQARDITQAAVPTGLVKVDDPDMTAEDAAALKRAWIESQRTRTIAVLNSTTDFVPLAWSPKDTELVAARRFSLLDWALIFGVPGSFLGADQNTRTYSNVEHEGLQLLKYSINGHLARIEQTLSLHHPRGTFVKANVDGVLRADTKTRYEAHEIGIRAGFLTRDEARALEERPPLTAEQRAELIVSKPQEEAA